MRVLAVDPGLGGALAIVDTKLDMAAVFDMPLQGRGRTGRKQVDSQNLVRLISGLKPDIGVVEQVSAMPKQGVSSMFSLGDSVGCIRTAIAAAGIPYVTVLPRTWKGFYGIQSKEQSRELALRLFPDMADNLKFKKHHDRAEALLIAEWFSKVRV